MLRWPLVIALLLLFPAGSRASDFWDEVRAPGLTAHAALLADAARALRRDEGNRALDLLAQDAAAFARHSDTLRLRGLALGLVGHTDQAIATLREALVADPLALDDPQWGTRAALLAAKGDDFVFAASILQRAIGTLSAVPVRRELFVFLGDVLLTQGPEQLPQAIVAYREALRGGAMTDARALIGLSLALRRNDERTAATEVAARLTAASRVEVLIAALPLPEPEKAARLAIAAEVFGDIDTARTHWTEASITGPWQNQATSEAARIRPAPGKSRARGRQP